MSGKFDKFKAGRSSLTSTGGERGSLIDPALELSDPCPDIFKLFLEYNARFFEGRLGGCEVKWSHQMTTCAGVCSYEGRGGLCSIRLSRPLLTLRPRKDLVETLLHEMIHAYLFVTARNTDRDGHGPEFQAHMHRINQQAGTHITIYHSFHAEVALYKQHWWRCDGPCQHRPPFHGWVKRAANRAPGPNDRWWAQHLTGCGGTFVKVKEPAGYGEKKTRKPKEAGGESKRSKSAEPVSATPAKSPQKTLDDFWKPVSTTTSPSTSALPADDDDFWKPVPTQTTSAPSFTPFGGTGARLGGGRGGGCGVRLGDYQLGGDSSSSHIPLPVRKRGGRGGARFPFLHPGMDGMDRSRGAIPGPSRMQDVIDLTDSPPVRRKRDDEGGEKRVPCPVCSVEVEEKLVNAHLDRCLA